MKFYLGTHRPQWLWSLDIPLFVSRRTMSKLGKKWWHETPTCPWALDSGGFTELSMFGEWTMSAKEYALELRRYESVGKMAWAAPQDWMCEPWILNKTGLTVTEHQKKTVYNYIALKELGANVIPVLQGWTLDDYRRCADLYHDEGVDLRAEHTVGLGSVCRRQATDEIGEIVRWAHANDIRCHGFGVKSAGLRKYGDFLVSADSLAWSYTGRYNKDPECPKLNCANCLHFALSWREKVLSA